MPRILVVEGEEDPHFPVLRTLRREGYTVSGCCSGRDALRDVQRALVDLLILDLDLPDIDGAEVCRTAREAGFEGGIMVVTARAAEFDRVHALDLGADDVVSTPFALAEFLARVRALARRSPPAAQLRRSPTAAATQVRVDRGARRASVGDHELVLTAKEFDVLAMLAVRRERVVARDQFMSQVWSEEWFGSTKTLDVTVARLRHKLADAGATDRIVAVRGVGYRLEAAA